MSPLALRAKSRGLVSCNHTHTYYLQVSVSEHLYLLNIPFCSGPNVHSHCCYDYDGNLKVGPPGGGHMNLVQTLELEHLRGDFLPYVYCCKDSRFDNCDFYYENRPSDDGSRYLPPLPGLSVKSNGY